MGKYEWVIEGKIRNLNDEWEPVVCVTVEGETFMGTYYHKASARKAVRKINNAMRKTGIDKAYHAVEYRATRVEAQRGADGLQSVYY